MKKMLGKIFNRKSSNETLAKREIYFHEDNYCQIEVLPLDNLEYCRAETIRIDQFSDNHKAENGLGWTDVYVRTENPSKFVDLKIEVDKFCSILAAISLRFDCVITGYGNYKETCKTTIAYGLNKNVAVFFDFNLESNYVTNVWLELCTYEQEEKEHAIKILKVLSSLTDLMLVDWGWGFVSKLSDIEYLEEYFNKRIEVFCNN